MAVGENDIKEDVGKKCKRGNEFRKKGDICIKNVIKGLKFASL